MANGDEAVRSEWRVIGSVIAGVVAVLVIMVAAAWTIITNEQAANKAIIDELHANYVQKTQHNDLVDRLVREVNRVDELGRDTLPRGEFSAWRKEHEKIIVGQKADIERLRQKQDNYVSKLELQAHVDKDAAGAVSLRREIDQLSNRLDSVGKVRPSP